MIYGSVCSGIEAATVSWKSLGWEPAWFSEIDPFSNSVLEYRYPKIPNLGDMTKIHEHEKFKKEKIDLLVGGTPCQSFSQAGLRGAFDDERGDLALKFIRIISIAEPEWFLWENVTGVLSSDKGKSFQTFIYQIQKLGYGFAYRVFDSQFFGVPQRRRRIFFVGHRRDWRLAAEVLFEPQSLRGNFTKNDGTQKNSSSTRTGIKKINKITGADVYNYSITGDVAATFGANSGGTNTHGPKLIDSKGIRKFTPIECERLMGFPDNYTLVPHKGKSKTACLDSWRYKALGNSMVVPVMRWIGNRIHKCQS